MSQKVKHRISMDANGARPKTKYYTHHSDGYGFQNGDFVFSSDLDDWKYGKTRRGAKYKNLF